MSFYLSNSDTGPTGLEPAEFLDVPLTAEATIDRRFVRYPGEDPRPFVGVDPEEPEEPSA